MSKPIMSVPGANGQVDLLPDRIVIHRKGLWNAFTFGFNARREIPLGAISEVMFRDASKLQFGSIEFVRSGRSHNEGKSRRANINAVTFNKASQPQFEKLKEKIFDIVNQTARQQSK